MAPIAVATTSRTTPATATASSLPTVLRLPHHTPALPPSPAIPSRPSSSRSGTPTTASNTRHRVHRTLLCQPRTTIPTMLLRSISSNRRRMVPNPNTNPLPSRPTASLTRLPSPSTVLPTQTGVLMHSLPRHTERTAADVVDAAATTIEAATMIEAAQRGS